MPEGPFCQIRAHILIINMYWISFSIDASSIGVLIAPMTSQNGGQDGRHGSKMAAMAPIQAQLRVTTSDDPVTRTVSPRKVS